MVKMYRISYMLFILLWSRSSDGKCLGSENAVVKCESMEEDVVDLAMREYGCYLNRMEIRDSSVSCLQMPSTCSQLPASLAVINSKITSFSCWENASEHGYFDVLRELDLSCNEIKELSFLKKAEYMEKLVLRHNRITFLNGTILRGKNNLFHLDLSHNEIKDFTTLEGQNLRFLNLSHNLIEVLGNLLVNSKNIQEVDLSHNKLKKISLNDFKDLKYMRNLNLGRNEIHTIEYNDRIIYAFQNPFWGKQDGNFPDSRENPYRESEDYSFELLNLEGNSLENLHFLVNQMRSRVVGKSLVFRKNKIKELVPFNFGGFKLERLDLSHNEIESIPFETFEYSDLKELYLDHNKLTHLNGTIFHSLSDLKLLNLSYNPLATVSETAFWASSPKVVDFSHCLLKKVPPGNFTELLLDFNFIQSTSSNLNDLNSLSIVKNNISITSLLSSSRRIKWKRLSLSINGRLEKKSFLNLISLEEMRIVHSNMTEIKKNAFAGLFSLKKISSENTTVLKIEPGAFLGLKNVEDFDVQNLFTNMRLLEAETFVGLDRLEFLNLSARGIRVIDDEAFLGLDNLRHLYLSHNDIKYLLTNSFVGLKKLQVLDLSNNKLSEIPTGTFRNLVELSHLHLEHNSLIEFGVGSFSNLNQLTFLNVSHNEIRSIGKDIFYPLTNLKVLDISFNRLEEFDYYLSDSEYYRPLKTIALSGNYWSCEYLTNMLIKFDKYFIDYTKLSSPDFEDRNIHGINCNLQN